MADFWQQYTRQIPYMDKAELVASGEVIAVHKVERVPGTRYGDQWVLHVTRENGDEAKVSFPCEPNRDSKMAYLIEQLGTGINPIVCRLRSFETRNGTGYDLAPPDYQPEDEPAQMEVPF